MRSPRKMMLLLRILAFLSTLFVSVMVANSQDPLCLNIGNYTANEPFDWKLDALLDSIATTGSSELNDDGLFNASQVLPGISDIVQVLGYCRGDQTSDACRSCLRDAADRVRQMCPLQKQAVLFEDECTLKYSNGSMYGVVSEAPFLRQSSGNATDWGVFQTVLKQMLDDLGSRAASGGLRKYAQDSRPVDLYTLYAAVMCSPDLSDQQCSDCLVSVTEKLKPGYVAGSVGAPSCQVRYDVSRFFNPIATPSPPPLAVSVKPETRNKISSNVWIAVGASTASAVLIGVAIFFSVKRKRNSTQSLKNAGEAIFETLQYSLDIIRDATDNFSEENKLGQGGFGSVFRGKFPNRQEIAVKQLSKNSGQGPMEFKNEVALLGRLQHKNLVRLLGFCLESDERLLIYEFLPNLSLDQFIFDPLKRRSLHWDIRHKIIMGIARGLLYLHEESGHRIIHRDLKASNILLDGEMNPKLSDFGMARLFKIDQTQADTSRIVGTHGYMAPEYLMHGHFSTKSDVFSFGVLVLEILSGRRNLDFLVGEEPEVLISRVWRNWSEGKISSIIDPLVETGYSLDIKRCIHIGLSCVQEDVALRPTMASIILMLNSNSTSLPVPIQPAFSMASQILPELGNTSETSRRSNTENTTGSSSVNEHSTTNPNPQ